MICSFLFAVALSTPFGEMTVRETEFPDRMFRLEESAGDFNAAITACARAGGGTVVVPAGTWTTGAIRLRSNVCLQLEAGAVVDFTDDPKDYPPVVSTWEGIECINHSPLIYAFGCTNVAIVGRGELRPRMKTWKAWAPRTEAQIAALGELYHWGATNAPIKVRDVTRIEGACLRPQLILFNRSSRILLDGIRIRESPFWTIHLYHSEDCILRNLDVKAHGANNDGVDVDMTRNVLIEDCRFDQGDDGICLKAGRNQDAWRLNRPTENVVIRNCHFVFANAVVALGSELSGGIRNVWAHDCEIEHPFAVVRFKTNRRRGGFVKNVWVERMKGGNGDSAAFFYETRYYYQWARYPDYELRATEVDGIHLKDITLGCANWAVNMNASAGSVPKNITLENVHVGAVREGFTNLVNAAGVELKNVTIGDAKSIRFEVFPEANWH